MTNKVNVKSLLDYGYDNIGLDDNWQACHEGYLGSFHDETGYPLINLERFPDMRAMNDYAHSIGLKSEWYGNNCICREFYLWKESEILDHYHGDVNATIDFGFDGNKLDGCGQFLDLELWEELYNAT